MPAGKSTTMPFTSSIPLEPLPSHQQDRRRQRPESSPDVEWIGTAYNANPIPNQSPGHYRPRHPLTLPPIQDPLLRAYPIPGQQPQSRISRSPTNLWHQELPSLARGHCNREIRLPPIHSLRLPHVSPSQHHAGPKSTLQPSYAAQSPDGFLSEWNMSSFAPVSDPAAYRSQPQAGPAGSSRKTVTWASPLVDNHHVGLLTRAEPEQVQQATDEPSAPPHPASAVIPEPATDEGAMCRILICAQGTLILKNAVHIVLEGGISTQQLRQAFLDGWVVPREKGEYDLPLELLLGRADIKDLETLGILELTIDKSKGKGKGKGKSRQKVKAKAKAKRPKEDYDPIFGGSDAEYYDIVRETPIDLSTKFWYMHDREGRSFVELAKESLRILTDLAFLAETTLTGDPQKDMRIIAASRTENLGAELQTQSQETGVNRPVDGDVDMLSQEDEGRGHSLRRKQEEGGRKGKDDEDLNETNRQLKMTIAELKGVIESQQEDIRVLLRHLESVKSAPNADPTLRSPSSPSPLPPTPLSIRHSLSFNNRSMTPALDEPMADSDPTVDEGPRTPSLLVTSPTPSPAESGTLAQNWISSPDLPKPPERKIDGSWSYLLQGSHP
ncbi:hypothetical protein I317_07745 [Kwoniella heveanensis CBS 569]|nr:hypothetical protein I317_07745 [Kwoniella heveanensis CBS 569]